RGKHPPGAIPDGSNTSCIGKSICPYSQQFISTTKQQFFPVGRVSAVQNLQEGYYFFAKTLDFFASLLYHGEVLKRNVMNINRLRYRRGKREWNGLSVSLC